MDHASGTDRAGDQPRSRVQAINPGADTTSTMPFPNPGDPTIIRIATGTAEEHGDQLLRELEHPPCRPEDGFPRTPHLRLGRWGCSAPSGRRIPCSGHHLRSSRRPREQTVAGGSPTGLGKPARPGAQPSARAHRRRHRYPALRVMREKRGPERSVGRDRRGGKGGGVTDGREVGGEVLE